MANKDEKITVVASCDVTSAEGTEIMVSFDRAWRRALELPRPVHVSFTGFVRKN